MLSSVHKQNFFEFKMHFTVCLSLSSTAQVKMDLGGQPDPCQRLSFDDQLTVTHKPSYTKNYEKKIQCTCKSASKNILIKT